MTIPPWLVLACTVGLVATGCGIAPASLSASSPSGEISGSPDVSPLDAWAEAAIEQPAAVTTWPSWGPDVQCHPCHFLAENDLFGVGATRVGLIAVGVQQPPPQAVAFSSNDGTHWVPLAGFGGTDGTAAVAVASNESRTVIVGHDTLGATAWTSTGGSWSQAPPQVDLEVPHGGGEMTSVASLDGGFVAGGYADDPMHALAHAAVWRSRDGLRWTTDDGAGAFDGGRVWGVAVGAGAVGAGAVVAVGTGRDPVYGPAAAWRWTSSIGWQRARIGPDAGGAMRAVAATPRGFLAVGLNGHDDGARAWTSTDGLDWTVVPDQPAFRYYGLPLRMASVIAGPAGIVAGGWRSDAGKGSAVTWTSPDGLSWTGPAWQNSFSGAQIDGLTVIGGSVIAVGRTGYPDWNTAQIWTSTSP